MLQQKELLVILASIVAFSSCTRIIESEKSDGVKWIEEKSFRMMMSWYSKQTDLIHVLVIHSSESNLMHRHLSKFISAIHEKSKSAVVMSYRLIKTENSTLNGSKPYQWKRNRNKQLISVSNFRRGIKLSREAPRRTNSPSKESLNMNVAVILVPDKATFFDFLSEGTIWHTTRLELTLIIVISDTNLLCEETGGDKYWKISVKNILQRIWSKKHILNVFLLAPSSSCIKDYIFSWDPFEVKSNGDIGALKRLKVTGDDLDIDKAMSGFLNTINNMNGYPLRVAIFKRFPTVFIDSDPECCDTEKVEDIDFDKLKGMDSLILKTMISSMNCSVFLYPPSNNAEYGYRIENGSFVGIIGDIIYQRVDFAANGIYLKDYETTSATEFTTPVGWDSICVVIPRADFIPLWLQTFLCFTPLVWGLMFLNIVICSLMRHAIRLAMQEERPQRTLLVLFIETLLTFVSSPRKLPRGSSERTLLGFWLLFGVIMMGTFEGTLYDSFTNPRRYHEINTLAELDKSGLEIGTGSPNLKDTFGQDDDSLTLMHLRQKVKISDNFEISTIERTASKKDIAAIERENDLYLSINTKFLDKRGNKVLHIIRECPRSYYLTYLVPSGAFYLRRMNHLLGRMFEAGLPTYWYNSTVDFLIMKHHYEMAKKKKLYAKDQAVAYNFVNLQTSFIILACGLLLSTLVFIGEKIRFYYITLRVTTTTRKSINPTTM